MSCCRSRRAESRRDTRFFWQVPLGVALVLLPVLVLIPTPAPAAEEAPPRPRLVVLVVFDQFRGDYLNRWQDLFIEDGFRRLLQDGAWFQNCHYPYAGTQTGPGHASMLTGCSPDRHGIISNEWYDRAAGEKVNCATTPRYQRVPPPEPMAEVSKHDSKDDSKDDSEEAGKKKEKGSGSPDRLLAPSLSDVLKAVTNGLAIVVALSIKDRSCVLPGGRHPNACYWFDSGSGRFVTSTYYRDRVHAWVEEFNRGRPADRWFGQDWLRLRPDLDYAGRSGPDDVAGEGKGQSQGRTFPHPMTGGLKQPARKYYDAVVNSPFGNELLLELAKRAVDAERLGADDVPDLLTVSFSSNDMVGHCWGPDSQEVLDTTLRSDLIVRDLLAHLDARVGKGRYVLALTADHGICPLPEVAKAQGKDAARVLPGPLNKGAEAFLNETFSKDSDGKARWLESTIGGSVYLNRALVNQRGLVAARVEEALAGWFKQQPSVQTVYTRSQLLQGIPESDVLGQRVRRSFHPERSSDLVVVFKPYYLPSTYLTGTNHGTPHAYDTHVPLLVYGTGIRPGVRQEAVTPQACAAILAHSLGLKPPEKAEAPLPESLK